MYKRTTATKKVYAMTKRIRAVQGGTSASKTISILIKLIGMAQRDTEKTLTSIVAESLPHLKRWAMRDFLNIMKAQGYFYDDAWNISNSTYTFETGSVIEFFSADQPDKLRWGRRDRLFLNECNNVSLDVFEQLEVRTKEFIFLDWNPSNEFWYYSDVAQRDDVEHLILTYKDNEALSPEIVASIEQRKDRKSWWTVYWEGLLGETEERIYTGWVIIDEIPHEARLVRRWLDFWYTNDPTALVDIYEYNWGYILHEQLYRKGMSNKQIADIINNLPSPNTLVIADSAEPKSIDEIKWYWVTILPCEKWPDSIKNWIQLVQWQRISMTKESTNLIKEYRNYLWMKDRDGKVLNVPESGFDHLAGDATRYALSNLLKEPVSTFNYDTFKYREKQKANSSSKYLWL